MSSSLKEGCKMKTPQEIASLAQQQSAAILSEYSLSSKPPLQPTMSLSSLTSLYGANAAGVLPLSQAPSRPTALCTSVPITLTFGPRVGNCGTGAQTQRQKSAIEVRHAHDYSKTQPPKQTQAQTQTQLPPPPLPYSYSYPTIPMPPSLANPTLFPYDMVLPMTTGTTTTAATTTATTTTAATGVMAASGGLPQFGAGTGIMAYNYNPFAVTPSTTCYPHSGTHLTVPPMHGAAVAAATGAYDAYHRSTSMPTWLSSPGIVARQYQDDEEEEADRYYSQFRCERRVSSKCSSLSRGSVQSPECERVQHSWTTEDPNRRGFRRVPVLGEPLRTDVVHVPSARGQSDLDKRLKRTRTLLRLNGSCAISGIGRAVANAAKIAEQLKREKVAVISKIVTSMVNDKPSLRLMLSCGEWGHLVSDFRRRKVVEVFELYDTDIKGELSTEVLRSLQLASKLYSDESAHQKAEQMLAEYSALNLPQFVEYCSILIHPLLLEYHFKQAIFEIGGKVDLHSGSLPAVQRKSDGSPETWVYVPMHIATQTAPKRRISGLHMYRLKVEVKPAPVSEQSLVVALPKVVAPPNIVAPQSYELAVVKKLQKPQAIANLDVDATPTGAVVPVLLSCTPSPVSVSRSSASLHVEEVMSPIGEGLENVPSRGQREDASKGKDVDNIPLRVEEEWDIMSPIGEDLEKEPSRDEREDARKSKEKEVDNIPSQFPEPSEKVATELVKDGDSLPVEECRMEEASLRLEKQCVDSKAEVQWARNPSERLVNVLAIVAIFIECHREPLSYSSSVFMGLYSLHIFFSSLGLSLLVAAICVLRQCYSTVPLSFMDAILITCNFLCFALQ